MPIGQRETILGDGRRHRAPVTDPVSRAVRSPVEVVAARHPHAWVNDGPNRWPALVIEQARTEDGWIAHVVMATTGPGGARTTIQGWMPAEHLEPAQPVKDAAEASGTTA